MTDFSNEAWLDTDGLYLSQTGRNEVNKAIILILSNEKLVAQFDELQKTIIEKGFYSLAEEMQILYKETREEIMYRARRVKENRPRETEEEFFID